MFKTAALRYTGILIVAGVEDAFYKEGRKHQVPLLKESWLVVPCNDYDPSRKNRPICKMQLMEIFNMYVQSSLNLLLKERR